MVNKKLKKAFSLAEVVVVMMLLALFFLASTKVMTQKPKPKSQIDTHGAYECYYDGGLKQRLTIENEEFEAESVSRCEFKTQPGVAIYNMNGITKDGGYQDTEPNVNQVISITVTQDGVVTLINETGEQEIVQANIEKEDIVNYFGVLHKKSKIYNNNVPKYGLMISW